MVTNPESQITVPWTVNTELQRAPALQVILLKRTYVLPWSRFIYAEGDLCSVVAAFTTHDVVVTGCGLDRLLGDLGAQRITTIRQPARTDKFLTAEAEVRIDQVNVNEVRSAE